MSRRDVAAALGLVALAGTLAGIIAAALAPFLGPPAVLLALGVAVQLAMPPYLRLCGSEPLEEP